MTERPLYILLYFLSHYRILAVFLALFLAGSLWSWIARRRATGRFHPARESRPGPFARRTEAAAILGLGTLLLLRFSFLGSSSSRPLGTIPACANSTFFIVLAGVFMWVALAHFLALFGRTRAAVLLITLWVLAFPSAFQSFRSRVDHVAKRDAPIVHQFRGNPSHHGVELWVNGVLLGELPLTIRRDEFLEKVPYRPEPPEGYDHELERFQSEGLGFDRQKNEELMARRVSWFGFPLNEDNGFWHTPSTRGNRDDVYYARLRLGDEWGVGKRPGYTSKGLPTYPQTYGTQFTVEFDNYTATLDRLIDQARILGSDAGPDWFRAIESHGVYGEQVFRKEMQNDPALEAVADAWARWRYGFGSDLTPDSAREALEAIRAAANGTGDYSSNSIAGRAVELVAPSLDPEHLADETVSVLRRNRSRILSCSVSDNGRSVHFSGDVEDPRRANPGVSVLINAVLIQDRLLDSGTPGEPNIFEREIPGELLCWWHNYWGPQDMDVVLALGGPDAERFLLRQDWQSEDTRDTEFLSAGGRENKWLKYLVNLDTPTGDKFRREHEREVLEYAEKLFYPANPGIRGTRDAEFLFFDKDRGKDSLAMKFWPRYLAFFEDRSRLDSSELEDLFDYLIRMEPSTAAEMYLDSWRENATEWNNIGALRALESLPGPKQRTVLTAILGDLEGNPDYYMSVLRGSHRNWNRQEEDWANRDYVEKHWPDSIRGMIEKIPEGAAEDERIQDWVEGGVTDNHARVLAEKPDALLVTVAAHHEDPQVRLMTRRALIEHPSEKNQRLLAGLLNDSDERVRTMAQEVKRSLEKLAAIPPAEFAHPLAGGEDYERSR